MVLFALAILVASGPVGTAPDAVAVPQVAAVGPLYRRPSIPPYEPPSDFGRQGAEGDTVGTEAGPVRRTGARTAPGATSTTGYEAAVTDRVRQAEALMGPLDGLWRVVDDRGQTLLNLALVDPGKHDSGQNDQVEGAWTRSAGPVRSGTLSSSRHDDQAVVIELADGLSLTLSASSSRRHWQGDLRDGRRVRKVRLISAD